MLSTLNDEQIILRYLATQSVGWLGELYSRYNKSVYRRCMFLTHDPSMAQDYTHDIFLKVFLKPDRFQQKSSFSTWLYSITTNYCTDQIKSTKRLMMYPLESTLELVDKDSTEEHEREETLRTMRQSIAQAGPEKVALLRLKYVDGLSVNEIAQLYDLKVSTVKMRLKRSKSSVRQLYTNTFDSAAIFH